MKNHHIFPTIALATLSLASCTTPTTPTSEPETGANITTTEKFTWAPNPYPTEPPSLFTQDQPGAGWYTKTDTYTPAGINKNDPYTYQNYEQWQTIYSYTDSTAGPGASIAVIFRDPASCTYDRLSKRLASEYIASNYYGYVAPEEGRTYPPQKGEKTPGEQYDGGRADYNAPPNQETPVLFSNHTANDGSYLTPENINTPGRTVSYHLATALDSNGQKVELGCSVVLTALSNEAAQTYDADTYATAYEQAERFAQSISGHKIPL